MMRRVWLASIWHPDAIPPDEWKYRSLKRVWLPVYDLIAIGAGIWAALFGSPVLHELFDEPVIDTMGTLLAIVATTCLLGVAFPHLWRWEICGKALLVALLAAYAAAVVLFRANPAASAGFVAFIIVLALPLPIFRLTLLGEEIKERREEDA
ncbi:hypothetical protein F6W69_10730 [Microbacterium oxydans]|uniref:hypothetical protein n=1 Tax=Microbacterium oxydans TaxID=82380 RepID=UPI001143569F|nr:hypothetical protein [Microbacterium oxydans]KAB1891063.1 hypothetical protein F6W69_10730 [Microbacterium oxydans]